MRLVLVRHGQSVWNLENIFTGWSDVDLSHQGRKEASESGRKLLEAGIDFDVVYTSYLKRAIHTATIIMDEMNRNWLPLIKAWQLNERHYGALQGLNKAQTAEQYGDDQVKLWRRSYTTLPPLLEPGDNRDPHNLPMYRDVDPSLLPMGESLAITVKRVLPYFNAEIKRDMLNGQRVLVVAHGNSLRALLKELEEYSDDDIISLEIPTGSPLVLEFDDDFSVLRSFYL